MILKKLEARDDSAKTQFSRFIVVGGTSTLLNYAVFYLLFSVAHIDYITASATGYVVGAALGYLFNARITFRKRPGLSIIPYFSVYALSLIGSLGVLKFFTSSLLLSPLVSNVMAIGFSTVTNFIGCRYVAFSEKFRPPSFFRSKIFLAVLVAKIVLSFLLASDFMTTLFLPFVKYFVSNPLANPYQNFLITGAIKSFPYPPLMLYLIGIPYILLYAFSINMFFELFAMRVTLLVADVMIFYTLYKIFRGREKYTLLLYWASPVIFYVTYIHGQLDMIPVALLFASIYFLINKKNARASLLLGAAFATKSFVIVAAPLVALYLLKKGTGPWKIVKFFAVSGIFYIIMIMPYFFSEGFQTMVFHPEEQLRLFNLSVSFSPNLLYYIVPALYAYIIFKAANFKKITRDVLFVLLGLTLTLFVTFINPARGWYIWVIPFLVYFFIKEKKMNLWIYVAFNIAYLSYFFFVPDSDVFEVFQVVYPPIALYQTPYYYLLSIGLPANLLVNILFTALTSTLLYSGYLIYKNGIKSSMIFQEQNGIPVIGISGDSGSGKTTLAASLADFFGRHRVTMVYGDDVHKWERGDEHWNKYTHLNPVANMIHDNYRQLMKLKRGRSIARRHYDHGKGRFTKPIVIKPKDIIISEGLHTLFINESNTLYEIKIYLDPDPQLRLWWKIRRDVHERKHSTKHVLDQVKKRKNDTEKFISPQKYYSDVIVSFRPEDKIDFKEGKEIATYSEVYVKNDIPIEKFLSALSKFRALVIDLEYPDHRFQKVTFRGQISKEELEGALKSLEINYEEYEIVINSIKEGINGVVQLLILFCLDNKLKSAQRVDEFEF